MPQEEKGDSTAEDLEIDLLAPVGEDLTDNEGSSRSSPAPPKKLTGSLWVHLRLSVKGESCVSFLHKFQRHSQRNQKRTGNASVLCWCFIRAGTKRLNHCVAGFGHVC